MHPGTPPTTPPRPPLPTPPPPQPLSPVVHTTVVAAAPGGVSDSMGDRLLDHRIVFLGGEVDEAAAHRVTLQLLVLAADDPRAEIALYLDSSAGSATAAMAIHDTMRLVTPAVATWVVGLAASAAQFLLTAGAPGRRHALPHARVRLHRPSAGLGAPAGVHAATVREIDALTARYSGRDLDAVVADTAADRWFTAAEARARGLVDHVVGPDI